MRELVTRRGTLDDKRVQAPVLIAPWLHDAALVREMYGGEEGVAERIAAGEAARQRYERSGVVEHVPSRSATDAAATMPVAIDFYENADRGAIAQWPNRFAVMSWSEWLSFDAVALACGVRTRTLIVHGEDAAIAAGARRRAVAHFARYLR